MDEQVNVYKGVGKMSVVRQSLITFALTYLLRFLMVPRNTMEKDLKDQEKDFTDDINNLSKKVSRISRGMLRF